MQGKQSARHDTGNNHHVGETGWKCVFTGGHKDSLHEGEPPVEEGGGLRAAGDEIGQSVPLERDRPRPDLLSDQLALEHRS